MIKTIGIASLSSGILGDPSLPVVCNINVGHALPRCIIPFGVDAVVDAQRQLICFDEPGWNQ